MARDSYHSHHMVHRMMVMLHWLCMNHGRILGQISCENAQLGCDEEILVSRMSTKVMEKDCKCKY